MGDVKKYKFVLNKRKRAVGPMGPQTSMTAADRRRNAIAIRQQKTAVATPSEARDTKKISASYRKAEFQDTLDQKFEPDTNKAQRRKKTRAAIAKNRLEMKSLLDQGPLFTR